MQPFHSIFHNSHAVRKKNTPAIEMACRQPSSTRPSKRKDSPSFGEGSTSTTRKGSAQRSRFPIASIARSDSRGSEQFWANRRWADPSDPRDLFAMAERLSRAQSLIPELRQCTLDRLQAILAQLRTAGPQRPTDDRDGNCNSGVRVDSVAADPPSPPAQPPNRASPSPPQLQPIAAINLPAPPPLPVLRRVSNRRRVYSAVPGPPFSAHAAALPMTSLHRAGRQGAAADDDTRPLFAPPCQRSGPSASHSPSRASGLAEAPSRPSRESPQNAESPRVASRSK